MSATKDLLVCPKCSGELVFRQDDNEEIIKKRIEDQGNASLYPILDYYKNLNILESIDGNQTIEFVEKQIEDIVKK